MNLNGKVAILTAKQPGTVRLEALKRDVGRVIGRLNGPNRRITP
jgi:predicted RNA-binding protein YlqC (UPF0109 family)